jgi:serine/threonine protein kinase
MKNLQIRRKIATGSAVDAFLADTAAGMVLVQVSHPEVVADPELYGRFLDTTRVTSTQHKHPALLSPEITTCEPDGRFVLVTGPVSGRTAADHLRERGALDTPEAIRWGVRICDALEFLHAHGVVHGHLAPHNLFLDGDPAHPEVRLLDTALLLFRGTKSVPRGQILVAPEYLSPERCAGRRATPACDVYGMGVLLHELLTKEPPFSGRGVTETRALQLHAPLPPLRPGLEEWQPVLTRCLAKRATDRYTSLAELRDVLRTLKPLETPAIEVHLGDPEPSRPGQLQPGDVVGRYRIESLIGEGGMGHVFAARHLSIDRRVALKVLRPELSRVDSQVQRFMAEAQAVNLVKHPHIIEIEDLVREGERVFFVMELLSGKSLKVLAKDSPIELTRVVRLMRQAAQALSAAHSVGVIHRDIKPDNLVVEVDAEGHEKIKVLDFGVARIRGNDLKAAYKTQVGQVVGTPLWMAPEQVMGHEVDPRADVYSLCMVMYVLLTRRFPFSGSDLSQVVMQRLSRDAMPVGDHSFLGEPLPWQIQRLLEMGLSRDLVKRPVSMEWVATALEGIEGRMEEQPTMDQPVRSWWNRWRS